MAIYYHIFKHPLNVSDASKIDIETGMIFSSKNEVPADFKKNITPEGYRDKYVLKTRTNPIKNREDTIGEVEVTRQGGEKISSYSVGLEGGEGSFVETENKSSKHLIDSNTPVFILARPNVLDGGKGIRVDGIVRYQESTETFT